MSKPIKYLYRYYGNEKYILDVLNNKQMYHCQPSEFNDPFDCRPLIALRHGIADDDTVWKDFLYYWGKMYYVGNNLIKSDDVLKKEAEIVFASGIHRQHSWLKEYVVKQFQDLASMIRVCCFAKSPRNMIMWAHYANSHGGLAFMFRGSELLDKASKEFRGVDVTYDLEALNVRHFVKALESHFVHGDVWALPKIIHAKKTKHWVCEDEVRFFTRPEHKYLSFNDSALYGIIFGANCSDCFIRKVEKTLDRWHNKPRLFKASIEKSTHKLWIGK
jgi:hypothetical protein